MKDKKTYKDIWFEIEEDLVELAKWTPSISVNKLLEKMWTYEDLVVDDNDK